MHRMYVCTKAHCSHLLHTRYTAAVDDAPPIQQEDSMDIPDISTQDPLEKCKKQCRCIVTENKG